MMTQRQQHIYTHAHNIDDCLRNGSFVRGYSDGRFFRYMNGDYMGTIDRLPDGMVEVPMDKAKNLLPKCCK